MSDISGAYGTTSSNIATSSTTVDSSSDEFDDFLMLLTAQVENQDPLEPLDSTQFVEQLATFSALEEQITTNEWLEELNLMVSDIYTVYIGEYLDSIDEASYTPMSSEDPGFMSVDSSNVRVDESATITFNNGEIIGGDKFTITIDGVEYAYAAGTDDTIDDVVQGLAEAIEAGGVHTVSYTMGEDTLTDDSTLTITAGAEIDSLTVKSQSAVKE